jgi:hypothetical protein
MDGSTTIRRRDLRRGAWLLLLLVPVVLAALSVRPAFAEKRVALVIGNSVYRSVPTLDNPRNDAQLLAVTLRALGFALVGGGAQLDLDKAALDRAVQSFGAQLAGADVGLFYYAGHGIQVRGENYLIPIDANPTKEADVDFQMTDTNLVLRQMEGAGTRLNIVILDACRNNPFGGRGLAVGRAQGNGTVRLRDTSSGLAQMQAPEGTLISFATQPGSVAQDGVGGNSPYAAALAREMRRPGLDIFQTFNQVGLAVKRETGGVQLPWVSTSPIDGSFYFAAAGSEVAPGKPPAGAAAIAPPSSALPAARSDPQGKAAVPSTAATAALSAPAPAAPTLDVRRFDGNWIVNWVYARTPTLPEIRGRFVAKASGGVLGGEIGTPGKPGWSRWDGTVEPDGTITAEVEGLSGVDTKTDPFHRSPGTKFNWSLIGTLEGTSGTGTRADRDCDMKFAKQGPGPMVARAAPAPEPPPSALPVLPQADGLFTEQDMQRVRAIAAQDQLVLMPPFKIERPDPKLSAGLRKFVGIWASEIGFGSGLSRQAMLIVTSIDASSHAEGYWVWGSPTGREIVEAHKFPAGTNPFEAQIAGEKLTAEAGGITVTATLTSAGNLSIVQKNKVGELGYITLKPVWRLIDAERDAKR